LGVGYGLRRIYIMSRRERDLIAGWRKPIDYLLLNSVEIYQAFSDIREHGDLLADALERLLDAEFVEGEIKLFLDFCDEFSEGSIDTSYRDICKEAAGIIRHLLSERDGLRKECNEVEQHLGKALHYPWFKDDQKSFPGTTEKDGVCVGEHVPGTIAAEARNKIWLLEGRVKELGAALWHLRSAMDGLMGDRDLDNDDSPEFKAMQTASELLRGYEP
jgi:hypothetical protein